MSGNFSIFVYAFCEKNCQLLGKEVVKERVLKSVGAEKNWEN